MGYTTILVPVDFSKTNENVLAKARELKNQSDCTLTLLHVINYLPPPNIQAELPAAYSSMPLLLEKAEAEVQALLDRAGIADSGIVVNTGKPRDRILELQKEISADLIIMAKHSHKGLERLLGSTTNGVANKTTCDLLIVPD